MNEMEHNPFSAPTAAGPHVASARALRRRDPSEFTTPFRLFAWLMGGGLVGVVAGVGLIVLTVGIRPRKPMGPEEVQANLPSLMGGAGLYMAGAIALIVAVVFQMILTYRAWEIVQDGKQRTTPGKAVGFLFIPIFNFYWFFVAKYGLAKELNRFIDAHGIEARRPSPGAGLACSILMLICFVPLIGWFVMLPALAVLTVFLNQIATTAADIVKFQAEQADGAIS